MSFDGQMPDYEPCSYGGSATRFRGPCTALEAPYTVVIGASEVYGKYVEDPFPRPLAKRTGRRIVNLGVMIAGIDVFLRDEPLMDVVQGAETVVVQAMGAGNLSNRLYSVHPRRNDRYLRHAPPFEDAFPGVDFSQFVFTRHMLNTLLAHGPPGFDLLLRELRTAWIARMRLLLGRLPGRKVLLWIEYDAGAPLGPEPLFVTPDMLQALHEDIDKIAHCDVTAELGGSAMEAMVYPPGEEAMARRMLTPAAHARVADILVRVLRPVAGMAA